MTTTLGDTVGYQSFVKIAKDEESEDFIELPREKNGTILLSTVQAQFPSGIGLKYRSESGSWRGIRAEDNVLDPPLGGWGETTYYITVPESLKRKSSSQDSSSAKSRKPGDLLKDLIVLGLPFATTSEELEEHFTKTCGELDFHEIKFDRSTNSSRGFGFIRFKTEEGAKEALDGHHNIGGRNLEIRESRTKEVPVKLYYGGLPSGTTRDGCVKRVFYREMPMKLFIGRLPNGTTQEALQEYFSEFGELDDVFVPNPFRGFGFVTFASKEEGRKALRMRHIYEGVRLNVTLAEPKGEKPREPPPQEVYDPNPSNYTWNAGQSYNNSSASYGQNNNTFSASQNHQGGGGGGGGGGIDDLELKNMLYTFLANQQ